MKYTNVLFDADGTLFDFLRCEDEAVREVMETEGITPTDQKVKLYSEINDGLWKKLERGEIEKSVLTYRRFELLLEALGAEGDATAMAKNYMSALSARVYVFEGVEQMCQALFGKVKLYIVTNGIETVQKRRFAHCNIDRYFEDMFISGEVGYEKPSIEYFEHVQSHIEGFDKESALIVGDSLTSDMRGGINFGIDTCWYNPDSKPAPEDMELTCVAHSFEQIVDFILSED